MTGALLVMTLLPYQCCMCRTVCPTAADAGHQIHFSLWIYTRAPLQVFKATQAK